jgi:Ca-activated chloride channel homolog
LIDKKRFLLCILAMAAAFAWGQNKPPDSQDKGQAGFKIGVEVNMVNVPVTVRRPEGGFIKGLPQTAFRIYEDGVAQEIIFFNQEGVPTRISLVLDSSGSVRTEWGTIKLATKKFIENLKPEDQFSIVTFSSDIRLKMDWGRKFDRVDHVLSSIYCKDNTKLFDAIYTVCTDVFKGIEEKKAMIIMSDGMDNESLVSFEEALQSAVRSEAAIYVVSKTEAVRQLYIANSSQSAYNNIPHEAFAQAELLLRKLAYETGGRVLSPNSFGELGNVYAEVDEELRNQYSIGYISTNKSKDGGYRRIEVRSNAPNAIISARPGYYAADELKSRQ